MNPTLFKVIARYPNEPLTIKRLREYLDEFEKSWTEDDEKYMGRFEDHKIYVPYFSKKGKFEGYGWASIFYDGGLDFIIDRGEFEDE